MNTALQRVPPRTVSVGDFVTFRYGNEQRIGRVRCPGALVPSPPGQPSPRRAVTIDYRWRTADGKVWRRYCVVSTCAILGKVTMEGGNDAIL